MKLFIKTRSGRELVAEGLEVSDLATTDDLKVAFAKQFPKYYVERQRFTLPAKEGEKSGAALVSGKNLSEYKLQDGSVLLFKDLGPQVGYRTVFFWEYLGPMLTYLFVYSFPHIVYPGYSKIPQKNIVQYLAVGYWVFHYVKRILETFFVHRFSHATMPIFNLYKNCLYYWGFGAYVSYFINHPQFTSPSETQAKILLALALICQLGNLRCHTALANLRPPGSKEYVIPRGFFLFNFITCPNYTTEILGWVCFTIATQTAAAGLFCAAGALQMAQWAAAKHRRLRKTFDGNNGRAKYPRRWIMLPPVF